MTPVDPGEDRIHVIRNERTVDAAQSRSSSFPKAPIPFPIRTLVPQRSWSDFEASPVGRAANPRFDPPPARRAALRVLWCQMHAARTETASPGREPLGGEDLFLQPPVGGGFNT